MMAITLEDIFKKVDDLDTFLIENGCERMNEMEIVSYFKNASEQNSKVAITICEPSYFGREDE